MTHRTPAQLQQLLATHAADIEGVVRRYAESAMDRDDLRQEIAIAIWKAMPGFRGHASERTYVMRITQNRAISFRLRLARSRALFRPLDTEPESIDSNSGELQIEQLRSRFNEALAQLPASQYELIALALDGYSPRQIARHTGKSAGSVRVALHRTREALRRWVAGGEARSPAKGGRSG